MLPISRFAEYCEFEGGFGLSDDFYRKIGYLTCEPYLTADDRLLYYSLGPPYFVKVKKLSYIQQLYLLFGR